MDFAGVTERRGQGCKGLMQESLGDEARAIRDTVVGSVVDESRALRETVVGSVVDESRGVKETIVGSVVDESRALGRPSSGPSSTSRGRSGKRGGLRRRRVEGHQGGGEGGPGSHRSRDGHRAVRYRQPAGRYREPQRRGRRAASDLVELNRVLRMQGDAADQVAEVLGRTLTRLSAEVEMLAGAVEGSEASRGLYVRADLNCGS